jgi:hypothetical protein
MSAYTDQVVAALTVFDTTLSGFGAMVRGRPASTQLPRKELDRLTESANRAGTAASQLRFTTGLVASTGVDVVDLQVRLQGEAAALASALSGLADIVERQHFVRETFADALVRLDEAAQGVAAGLFPCAIEGLRDVNVALWDFDPLLWREFTSRFADVVQARDLTAEEQVKIQGVAGGVRQAFEDVNALLNALAENAIAGGPAIGGALGAARKALADAIATAQKRLTPRFGDFEGVIDKAAKIAKKVDRLLGKLEIPVYPVHDDLGVLGHCITPALYGGLSGVQRFALLNIAARLQSITIDGRHLLDPVYDVRVRRVFPDRIYLDASRRLIDDIAGDTRSFAAAPAGLHRYKDGSFKGTHGKTGNLQVSFARQPVGDRVDVDADIDLYRDPVRHLFGEVLVNHLTGRPTSQFAVQKQLAALRVESIGGFGLLPTA